MTHPDRPVRVRLAPSPTGNCHVGTARNALFNLLFARQHSGQFILRIDDTDEKRSTPESEQGVLEALYWLGLAWDEGPDVGGDHGPYRQSERQEIYQAHTARLIESGRAYPCFCTPQELDTEREAQMAAGQPVKYSGKCRHLSPQERTARLEAGQPAAVRFWIEDKPMTYTDLVQGEISQDAALIGDPVIVKSSGMPTYNFATVVDEIEMQVSHVLRSQEHINNTFPQLQMYEALGAPPPEFGHFSTLLNPDRSKISKRAGAVYIGEFRDEGYLPEAMINHLALSGWNPGNEEEIFTLSQLIDVFALDRVTGSNAIFDRAKLLYLNGYYIRQLSLDDLTRRSLPFLAKAGLVEAAPDPETYARVQAIMALEQERLKTLAEAAELVDFFFRDPDPAASIALLQSNAYARKHSLPELCAALTQVRAALAALDRWAHDPMHDTLDAVGASLGWKRGPLLMPVRIVVSGRTATPSLFETLEQIGQAATLRRLDAVIARLSKD